MSHYTLENSILIIDNVIRSFKVKTYNYKNGGEKKRDDPNPFTLLFAFGAELLTTWEKECNSYRGERVETVRS